jgi:TolB-like protein/DNA-binding winged helix-turn-helix (wHTH) protein/Flp pilus assembly protein TadD
MANVTQGEDRTFYSPDDKDFRLGDWRVSPQCNEISRGGDTIRLEPRTMAALLCLSASPGQVVTRDRLESTVWPGMVVGYDALSNTVARLRRALGDDPRHPQFIETIPKVGYRLVAEVDRSQSVENPGAEDAYPPEVIVSKGRDDENRRRLTTPWLVVGLTGAMIALVLGFLSLRPLQMTEQEHTIVEYTTLPAPARTSIAVLPFVNKSNDPDQEYFSDGLTDDLITELSRVDRLVVVSRSSTFAYKHRSTPPQQIGRELGVEYILEGSIRRAGDSVRINAWLIDAGNGEQLWADRYDGKLNDIFALQDRLTTRITQALSVTLAPEEESALASRDAVDSAAYEAFLKGREHFMRQTPDDFAAALRLFEQAITIEPGFSRAYGALAALYWEAKQRDWYPAMKADKLKINDRALEYLEKALEDPDAVSLAASARVRMAYGDFEAAVEAAKRAVDLAPSDADARNTLAETLIFAGRPASALAHITHAMRLDPLHQGYPHYLRGLAAFGLQRFDTAAYYLSRALELNPDYRRPAAVLAASRAMLGRDEKAAAALALYESEYPDYGVATTVLAFPYQHEKDRERLAEGLRRAGMKELAF